MLTLAIPVPTSFRAFYRFGVQLTPNVSEISSMSIVRVDAANDIELDDGDRGGLRRVGF
jgi:hypothetical protein